MSKKTIETNHRVFIEPRSIGDYGYARISEHRVCPDPEERARRYREMCEEIADSVRRHVDNTKYVSVECDKEEFCSHCGSNWDECKDDNDPEYPKGIPLCCSRAMDEFRKGLQ